MAWYRATLCFLVCFLIAAPPLLATPSRLPLSPARASAPSAGVPGGSYAQSLALSIGNVSTSYLSSIFIPVYLVGGQSFDGLTQVFSYNPNVLKYNGTLDDVASANVTFTSTRQTGGIVEISGKGTFTVPYSNTTLYYMIFTSPVHQQLTTNIILAYSKLGSLVSGGQKSSQVRLAEGWRNLGPKSIQGRIVLPKSGSGTVPAIGYSSLYPNTIYVASGSNGPGRASGDYADVYGYGGLFRSDDGGATWTTASMGLNVTDITAVAVSQMNPKVVVIATVGKKGIGSVEGGGIFKSVNGGESWQETYYDGGNTLITLGQYLFAASYHAILRSSDFGTTWQVISNFTPLVTTIGLSKNGSTMLVGLGNYTCCAEPDGVSIEKSVDDGATWTTTSSFTGYHVVSQLLFNPTNQADVWALVYHGLTNYSSLFTSTDGGTTWTPVNDTRVGIVYFQEHYGSTWLAEAPQALTIDPLNGNIVYVVGPGYVLKSSDGGEHFTNPANGYFGSPGVGQDNRMVYVDPANDSTIYVGSDQGLIVSRDAGATWHGVSGFSSSLLYSVSVSGQNIFTVAQDWPPIFSNDSGSSWYTPSCSTCNEEGWTAVDPYNSSLVVVISSIVSDPPLRISNNGGTSFFTAAVNETQFVSDVKPAIGVAFTDNSHHTMYVISSAGVVSSTDYGHSWKLLSGSPREGYAIAIDPSNQSTILVSTYPSGNLGTGQIGTYESTDSGATWSLVSQQYFSSLAIDPQNSSVVAGSWRGGVTPIGPAGEVMISHDGGHTFAYDGFSSTNDALAPPQVFFREVPGGRLALLYTCNEGIWVSYDLGATWSNYDFGLPGNVISDLAWSSTGATYISTYGDGVWYNPDLLNQTYYSTSPVLGGYLSPGSTLTIGGTNFTSGYFETTLRAGTVTFTVTASAGSATYHVDAANNGAYYYDSSPKQATFTETGLPDSTIWSVSLGSKSTSSSNTSVTITTLPAVYHFSVANVTGYLAYPQSGVVDLTSSNLTVSVRFQPLVTTNTTTTTYTQTASSTVSNVVTSTSATSTVIQAQTGSTTSTFAISTAATPIQTLTSNQTGTTPAGEGGKGVPEMPFRPLVLTALSLLIVASYILVRSRLGSEGRDSQAMDSAVTRKNSHGEVWNFADAP